jgi:hypothetical protein
MRFQLSESNGDPAGLAEECALWDWTRTAGVSAAGLREWLASGPDTPSPQNLSNHIPLVKGLP